MLVFLQQGVPVIVKQRNLCLISDLEMDEILSILNNNEKLKDALGNSLQDVVDRYSK